MTNLAEPQPTTPAPGPTGARPRPAARRAVETSLAAVVACTDYTAELWMFR